MSTGRRLPRVAFQGEAGAFSEEAVLSAFAGAADPVPYRDLRAVGDAVLAGAVEYGLLPVENSLAGSVVGAYDLLAATSLSVIGEVIRPIRMCLLGLSGAALDSLTEVRSHPIALAQCARFFAEHPALQPVASYDTAGAALEVARGLNRRVGAIAARIAAERYGLVVLAADVHDRADNQTRFFVVAPRGTARPSEPAAARPKSVLVAETENRPGALHGLLEVFAVRGINLTKLESRPGPEPWTYRFFIELEGSADRGAAALAVEEAMDRTRSLRVIGTYAAADPPSSAEPPGAPSGFA